jgi:pyruvyl transferase EpsO
MSPAVLRQCMPKGVILIHGGGNFGTLWPECQAHREAALAEFHDYPIVQLPQSIHFGDDAALQKMKQLIARHPDFTMLVRDEPSRILSEQALASRTLLCPDSAFFLSSQLARDKPVVDILALVRTDKERVTEGLEQHLVRSKLAFEIADWLDDPLTWQRRAALRIWPRASGRLTRVPGFFRLLRAAWDAAAWARIRRGTGLLSRGKVVVTDRLHAHILCTMMGIPHVVLDNSYGKVQSFIAAWTAGNPLVNKASTPQEAVERATEIVNGLPR